MDTVYLGCYRLDRLRELGGSDESMIINKDDEFNFRLALAGGRRPPKVIIVNPPRAGLNSAVIRSMVRLRPQRMVYVSCNPTTLARDLKEICERDYRLTQARPVDMFPHTYHIECVARIDRVVAPAAAAP